MIPEWLRTGVVYQVYPRSFQDSDGDGIGDLPGILARVPYLADLGVDVLWLSPVHPSPDADFGYDVADYDAVDPKFGTDADLDALIAACHSRGMKVLLDGVFNHTSDQHAWFRASRRSRDDPKRDWYIWRDPKNGGPPNNWASTFGGPAWTLDAATGQYWLHSFLPAQPDLNWRNPEVQEAVLASMRRWFERGIDGFRLDVFNCYRKHPDLPDNPRRWHPGGLVYGYIGQHHVHDRDQDDLPEVLGAMRALADELGAGLVGETMDENFRYDQAHRFVGATGLHLAFHFALLHSRWKAPALAHAIRSWVDSLPADGWPTWVLSNHDFPRHATRWGGGDARAKAAAVLALTLEGTPFLYYGEELGMPEARLARAQIVDPPGKRFWPFFKGRDGARTPMQWDASPNAGFTTGTPWLPVSPDAAQRNVAAQQGVPGSVLETYRAVLRLRRTHRALREGRMQLPDPVHPAVLAWTRTADETLQVVLNTRSRPETLVLAASTEVLLQTGGGRVDGRQVHLDADEAMILRTV
ncbi:MAG: alpha-amylase [Alphaproteobacteria bacterium]|nr:alpha-amylase [Alphaproteobacteria bacterium]